MNDFLSISNSNNNSCNNLSSRTIYEVMSENKILSIFFLLLHLIGYQIIGALVQNILVGYGINDRYLLSLYSTFISELIVVGIYIATTLAIKDLRNSFTKYRFASLSLIVAFSLIILFFNYFGSYIISLLTSFFTTEENSNQNIIMQLIKLNPTIMLITTVVLAPIAEEFAYRFGLVGIFPTNKKILAIISSGIIFGFIHFDYYTIGTNDFFIELANLPSYIFAGLLFSYAYIRSESGFPSITVHMVNNLISSLLIIFAINSGNL